MSTVRKHYVSLTGGALSLTRSKVTANGNRVGLDPIDFNSSGNIITSSPEKQEWLEKHPSFGKLWALKAVEKPDEVDYETVPVKKVKASKAGGKTARTDEAESEAEPDPEPEDDTKAEPEGVEPVKGPTGPVTVDVKFINEALQHLRDKGIDVTGVRSWIDAEKIAAENGIVFNRGQ